MMVRLILPALALLATPALAAEPAAKRAVDVRTDATDATAQSFVAALRAALPAGERVREQTPEEDDDLALVIADVKGDGKAGGGRFAWSIDLLKVNAGFTPSRVGSFTGKCREKDVAACARDVIADTDRAVRKAAKD